MRKGRRKSNVQNTNEVVKVKSSEEEEIKRPKCNRKSHVETVNEETKESSSEQEDTGISKCRRRSRVDNTNEEVKLWKSSPKQRGFPPGIKKYQRGYLFRTDEKKGKKAAL